MNPGFQEYFITILEFLSDKYPKSRKDVFDGVSNLKVLSSEIKREMLPNQSQPTYINRIGWAMTYLKKAGLLSNPSKGMWQITEIGVNIFKNPPKKFNVTFLKTFPSFKDFVRINNNKVSKTTVLNNENDPIERLYESFEIIKKTICQELLDKIFDQSPEFFEKLVIELILKMGYGGTLSELQNQLDYSLHTGKSGDEGIDGIISEDRLGLNKIYIQAKRWKSDSTVGRPEIQKFVGALSGQNAHKGIFLTTSKFSKEARDYSYRNGLSIVLIDGEKLSELMYEYSVGLTESQSLIIKELDNDYFEN